MFTEEAFRKLRDYWFDISLRAQPHEREMKDDSSERRRERYNSEMKEWFDADTDAILRGEDRHIRHSYLNDLR